jgi:hypothetical protein
MENTVQNQFVNRFLDGLTWPRILRLSIIGALLVGARVFLLLPREYTARASLLTRDEPDAIKSLQLVAAAGEPSAGGGALALLGGAQDPLRRMELVLRSRTVQEQLVEKFKLAEYLGLPPPEAIRALDHMTNIKMQGGGALVASSPGMTIEVTCGASPRLNGWIRWGHSHSVDEAKRLCADLTNGYVDLLDAYMANTSVSNARDTRLFIDKRRKEIEAELRVTEDKLQVLQQQYGLMDLASKTSEMLERTTSLAKALGQTATEAAGLSSSLHQVRVELPQQETKRVSRAVMERNPMISQLELRMADLQMQLAAALANGKSLKHPDVLQIQSQMRDARQQLRRVTQEVRANFTEEVNPAHDVLLQKLTGLEVELAGARASQAVLGQDLVEARRNLASLPPVTREYMHLKRQVDIQVELMTAVVKQLEFATIEEQRESSGRFQILDRAVPPDKKSGPSTIRNTAAAFFLLLMVLTAGWAYRRGLLTDSATEADERPTSSAT